MNNIQIQYQGFHPSEFTRAFLAAKLSEIQSEAPTGATLKAVFRRRDHLLTASVSILSRAGDFFAHAEGKHLREVCRHLLHRSQRQLERWHDRRKGRRSS